MENNSSILRKVIVTLFVVLCFILQCSVFNSLALGGIIPNLMIILTSSFGFMRGEKEGLLIGFFSGLLCDIFFGSFLGFYAMIMMYIGFINGKFCRIFYPYHEELPNIPYFFLSIARKKRFFLLDYNSFLLCCTSHKTIKRSPFLPVPLGQRRISLRILLWKFVFVTVEIYRNIDFISYIL